MSRKNHLKLLFLLLFAPLGVMAQNLITASGSIVDSSGEPMIGCTVQQKGGTGGVVTDLDGNFKLQVPKNAVLVFSFIGYKTQELKAAAGMKVVMKEDSHVMDEVVVVGYGTMKRSDITGSVVSVKAEDMQQTSASTMDQMLQGRAAGMQLTSNSGAAGGSSSIQIRGINSLNSSNEPVYVIDGAIITSEAGSNVFSNPLADLNPNDVESIEILKDASATAIYGAQAANGVIIVNMKKGFDGTAPKISFKAQVGWDMLPRKLDVMNLQQFAEWAREANLQKSTVKESDMFANPATLGEGADWQDALFRSGLRQEYNLSVRGGSKGINYSVSGGYFSQQGIAINNDFHRITLRASVDVKAYKWLDLGATFNLGQSDRNTGMASWDVVPNALSDTPNNAVRNPDGSWAKSGYNGDTDTWQPNPVALAELTTRENKIVSSRTNVYFTLKPWNWLTWKNEGTYDTNTDNYRYMLPEYQLGENGATREYATHQSSKTFNLYWSVKSVATGNWKIKKVHKLSAMIGFEMNNRYRDYLYGQRLGGSNTNMALSGGDSSRDDNAGYTTTKRFSSLFGRLTYNYKDRYMFTGTLRHDGSSLFERGQRWGTFPSAALAWRVSEEDFWMMMQEKSPLFAAVNSLKLRVGYGLVGNANLTESTFMANFANLESTFGTSYKTANMPNYDKLTWEKTDSWNVGLDLSLFDNRIEFIFDAFLKNTRDLLMQTALPFFSGTSTKVTGSAEPQWANIGNMRNKGIELTLNAHILNKKKLKWKTSLTYSLVQNEVTKLNSESGFIDKTLDYEGTGETITRTAVGHSISQFYGFQVAGRINSAADFLLDNGDGTSTVIAATPNYRVGTVVSNASAKNLLTSIGDLLYKDLNGDGVIDDSDKTFLGNGLPAYTFGWNNTITWKQFALSIFMYGSVGNKVFNWTRRRMDDPSLTPGGAAWNKYVRTSNYAKWAYYDGNSGNLDVWNVYVAPGADPSIPRIDNLHNNYNSRVSDRYVEDASYLRIKNVTLTYTLPKNLSKKFYMQEVRLSANIQNVYTFTGYTGYDPEVGSQNGQYSMSGQGMLMYGVDTGRVPAPRSVIFGIEATF
ncbi:MAG: TonB-dependent receptor [Prevotella sp.]|nr:TonB-dependent receptor [Prevotella sp.]